MNVEVLHTKSTILKFLKENPALQIYAIGDLDDFFWPKTIWYSLKDKEAIQAIALIYIGMDTPTLLAFHNGESDYSSILIQKIKNYLPATFYAHLSSGLLDTFKVNSTIHHYGLNYKMVLNKKVEKPQNDNIRQLNNNNLDIIEAFFAIAYPKNWFDSRMLETGKYYGYFIDDTLVGIAGIHVFSAIYKVAALGNIATHPAYRGQGIAYKVVSALCYDLQHCVETIGLNVNSENTHAIKCYEKIGFEIIGTYDECFIKMNELDA